MNAIITADLLFGDSGKGTVVDFLASKLGSTLIVRYNGGAQCAHNVYANGDHFCFKQLSSGSFCNADTLLLDTVIINPIALESEIKHFKSLFQDKYAFDVHVHADAFVTTPYHVTANQVEELVLQHGSCGMGIWKTVEYAEKYPSDAIKVKDIIGPFSALCEKLRKIREFFWSIVDASNDEEYKQNYMCDDALERIALLLIRGLDNKCIHIVNQTDANQLINNHNNIIFEGAQGVLLDKDRGFLPHVSATDTTTNLAEAFLEKCDYKGTIRKIGIIRSYATRHGAGPLPSEVVGIKLVGENNDFNEWQKDFRVGTFDKSLVLKALDICPVDELFITCLDNDPFNDDCNYAQRANNIAYTLDIPLAGISFGKERINKISCI